MNNETLLSISAFNFREAIKVYKYSTGDKRELNAAGYLLQQSVEYCIKHHMEVNSIKYPLSSIIEDLLDLCGKCIIVFSDEFYNFAPVLSQWEYKTRYAKNYYLTESQLKSGFRLVREFLLENGCSLYDLAEKSLIIRETDLL